MRPVRKDRMNITSAVKRLVEGNEVVGAWLLGVQAVGKTNTAKFIARMLEPMGFEVRYMSGPSLGQAVGALQQPANGKRIMIVFDDMSFLTSAQSLKTRRFLNAVTRVRHTLHAERIFIIFCMHYIRGLAPFLRQNVQIKVLMSVTEEDMNKNNPSNLRPLFKWAMLGRFRAVYDEMFWSGQFTSGDRKYYMSEHRPALVSVMTRSFITVVPKVEDYEFVHYDPPEAEEEEDEKIRVSSIKDAERIVRAYEMSKALKKRGYYYVAERVSDKYRLGHPVAQKLVKLAKEYLGRTGERVKEEWEE